jgi:glycosyltransferase involved in cell wall biosynthesis
MTGIDITPYETDPAIKVSVLMITYNQAPFVAQAIESVLAQEVPFRYELVVGEDCSTDRTRAIVQQYASRYPGRIRLILPQRNLGMYWNFIGTLRACRGQYVALLEGDDYWTCPQKLTKQTALLDSQPDLVACFHNANIVREDHPQSAEVLVPSGYPGSPTIRDLLLQYNIPTCSLVFRNGVLSELPCWTLDLGGLDMPLEILLAQHGDYVYLNEVMAAYRVHAGGVWSGQENIDRLRSCIRMRERVNAGLGHQYTAVLRPSVFMFALGVAEIYAAKVDEVGSCDRIAEQFLKELDNLCELGPVVQSAKRQILSKFCWNIALSAVGMEDSRTARRYLWRAVGCDPGVLLNRGTWGIARRAVPGITQRIGKTSAPRSTS